MEAQDIWDAVEVIDPKATVDAKRDKVARAATFSAVPEDILFVVSRKKTTTEA